MRYDEVGARLVRQLNERLIVRVIVKRWMPIRTQLPFLSMGTNHGEHAIDITCRCTQEVSHFQ